MDVSLAQVHPAVAARATYLVEAFRSAGWPVVVTSGYRPPERQAQLVKAGLTKTRAGRHNSSPATAFDVSFLGLSREEALSSEWRPYFEIIGQFGERLGLRWGGRFTDYDPFHFDAG